MKLRELPNVGPVLEQKLIAIGVYSSEELRSLGSKAAFMQLYVEDKSCCINLLMALEGAVQNKPKKAIDTQCKQILKEFYQEVQGL